MQPEVTLRQATKTDIPKLAALLNLCYRGDPTGQLVGWTNEQHLVGGIRTTDDELFNIIKDKAQYLFVFPEKQAGTEQVETETGKLLGCILVGFEKSGLENAFASIGLFAVHPSMQGKGVGDTILNAAITFAKRHLTGGMSATRDVPKSQEGQKSVQCKVVMHILAHRPELLAFYQRRGFELTGSAKPFPVDGNNGEPKRDDLRLLELVKYI